MIWLWVAAATLVLGLWMLRTGWLLIQEARRRRTEKITYG